MILETLGPSEGRRLGALIAALAITGLLQTAGIASIMPFLAVVSNPMIVSENVHLRRAYDIVGFDSPNEFLVGLGILFVLVMVAANGATVLTRWAVLRMEWRSQIQISHRLLARYLAAPYAFYLGENSSRLGEILLNEVARVVADVIIPSLTILARAFSTAFIVLLLVWADPLLALVVSLVIGGFYAFVYVMARNRQARHGEEALSAAGERFRVVGEAFGGIKDLKVLGRERHVLARFRSPSERYARANTAHGVVALLPRFALETIAYGGIVVVILYLLQTRDSLDQILPVLAVYAFGANRLMPAVQEIFSSLTQVRFNTAALVALHADLTSPELGRLEGSTLVELRKSESGPGYSGPLRFEREIRFEDVTFTYPGATVPAVQGINMVLPARRTTGFVGETGAGKTTIVELLLGLFAPTSGRISVDGIALDEGTIGAWRQSIGYVPQSIFLNDASIAENIAFGIAGPEIDMEAVRSAAAAAHLDEFVSGLPEGYGSLVGERGVRLSGGQKQRIGIARALYHSPDVIVMDEATSALDSLTEDVVMEAIRELGTHRTIIIIAHRLTTVQECDAIYLIEGGCIAGQGTFEELVASSPSFREMARI